MYENLVIGLTGSFGSGCNEAFSYLESKNFKGYSLSDRVKEEVIKEGIINPDRNHLQNIGDKLRHENTPDFLAIDIFKNKIDWSSNNSVVIKSIRNHHEARFFINNLTNFFLINIDAPKKIRFNREQGGYSKIEDFEREDERDTGDDQPKYGQHVKICVDLSDIIINNIGSKKEFYKKIDRYLNLIKNPGSQPPSELEAHMAQAHFWSLRSSCLKRKVGAIIVKNSYTIASGYNDTPKGRVIEKGKKIIELKIPSCKNICYRELSKECFNEECKAPITFTLDKCQKCDTPIDKERKDILDKHLDLCRAIHAEERAILQTAKFGGQSLENTTLYTTTFPCQLCAKKIVEVGISRIIYVDPYPYRASYDLLCDAEVDIVKFEGVKSKKFDNLYVSNV